MENYKHVSQAQVLTAKGELKTLGAARFSIGQDRKTNEFAVMVDRAVETGEILENGEKAIGTKNIAVLKEGFKTRKAAQQWLNENGVLLAH